MSLLFLTNGAVFATLLPRYPGIKEGFGLSATAFGAMVACMPVGSLAAAALPAPLITRFGAIRVAVWSSIALAIALAVAGFAGHPAMFAGMLAVAGFADAVTDAGQNVHAMAVQRWLGRSIINSMHALWSAGAILGGVIGTGLAAAGVPLGLHLALTGSVVVALLPLAGRWAAIPGVGGLAPPSGAPDQGPVAGVGLDGSDADRRAADRPAADPPGSSHLSPWRPLLPLVALAIFGTLQEDVANNWSPLYLNQGFGVAVGTAGIAFVVFVACQFVGRLTGDPLTDRFGVRAVATSGGLLVAAGLCLVVLSGHPAVAVAGFALAGWGCATLVPASFAAADDVPGWGGGKGIAVLGWLMRIGFLVTSPVVGLIVDRSTLRHGMVVPLVAGMLAAAIAATRLPRQPATS